MTGQIWWGFVAVVRGGGCRRVLCGGNVSDISLVVSVVCGLKKKWVRRLARVQPTSNESSIRARAARGGVGR